jgi:hypothetical protein
VLLIRHGAIAEVAIELLRDSIDVDSIFIELLSAVSALKLSGKWVYELNDWNDLPLRFRNGGNEILGIRLAEAQHYASPRNAYFAARLAQLLRESSNESNLEQALDYFRHHFDQVERNRSYYREWGKVETASANLEIGIWLTFVALCDDERLDILNSELTNERCKESLNNLSVGFSELYEQTTREIYKHARDGATQLALDIRSDGFASITQALRRRQIEEKMSTTTPEKAFRHLLDGGEYAIAHTNGARLPFVPAWNELSFDSFEIRLGIQ